MIGRLLPEGLTPVARTLLWGRGLRAFADGFVSLLLPAYLTVLVQAYIAGALPLDALMYALEKGRLPEDFQSEDAALRLIADEVARQDAATAAAKEAAKNPPPEPDAVPTDPGASNGSNGNGSGVRLSILKSRGGATGEWWLDLDAAGV